MADRSSHKILAMVASVATIAMGFSLSSIASDSMEGETIAIGQSADPQPALSIDLTRIASADGTVTSLPSSDLIGKNVSITLTDVRADGTSPRGFRAFLNVPEADGSTSIDHPGYVTSVTFFPSPDLTSGPTIAGSFILSLTEPLANLATGNPAPPTDLTLTLVPLGQDPKIGLVRSELTLD